MATTIKRVGFGQVEPNHLSAQGNRQIYAQLPLDSDIEILENGQFMKYDYANNEVNLTGDGEYMLVLNEVKVYDERDSYKDFAMIKKNYVGGEIYPRLFKTNVGDIYTTNCVGAANSSKDAEYAGIALDVGDKLKVDTTTGYLVKDNTVNTGMIWKVVKITTCPDAIQPAVKLQRIN
jgi:hypothetical protein